MTYSVFVKPTSEQSYNAIVLGFPFLRAEGATKKEVIDKIQKLLANLMASGEIVHVEVEEPPIAYDDEPLPEVGSPQMWQELETLSAILRAEALSNGQTVSDVLQKLPDIRREVFDEMYGKEQVEAWEKEWKDGG
ncbi:hypothetical protein FJZ31_41265 [Candidatus Poribacteria bacterium]|nr:hypothetical protein [Candidatus Poribacteria bacterium]